MVPETFRTRRDLQTIFPWPRFDGKAEATMIFQRFVLLTAANP